jgi:hypothetical protein
MPRARVKLVVTGEFDIKKEYYPPGLSVKEMAEMDCKNFEQDVDLFFDITENDSTRDIKLTVEKVWD